LRALPPGGIDAIGAGLSGELAEDPADGLRAAACEGMITGLLRGAGEETVVEVAAATEAAGVAIDGGDAKGRAADGCAVEIPVAEGTIGDAFNPMDWGGTKCAGETEGPCSLLEAGVDCANAAGRFSFAFKTFSTT